ncbi:MAG: cytochrome P450 [Chitinophagales bacterium]|nr:cytochrome P450 [Chitinophagales bacterium]
MTSDSLHKIPTAPAAKPFVGHLFSFRKSPIDFFSAHASNFKELFQFKIFSKSYIVLNHPDAVHHVLTSNVKNYTRQKSYAFLQELLGMGLLTNEGDEWRSRRRLAQPNFGREKLASLMQQMDVAIENFTKNHFNTKSTLSLEDELNHLTLSILTQSILYSENNANFEKVKSDLQDALEYLTAQRFNVFKFMTKLPSKRKSKGKAAIARLKLLVQSIILERRKSTAAHNDLLEMLMNTKDEENNEMLDDKALADEVMTMFVAGHETTASSLLWTIYLLEHNTAVRDKLLQELQMNYDGAAIDMTKMMQLPYMRMVIMESMRLYPPVWSFGRKAIDEDQIMGYTIPKGTSVNIPVYCIHRHPDYWKHPDAFYPEHFLPEAMKERDKFAYLPFSQGMHRCIGEHFAIMEMQMVLMRLYFQYEIHFATDKAPVLHPLVTLKPKEPIYFTIQKRKL